MSVVLRVTFQSKMQHEQGVIVKKTVAHNKLINSITLQNCVRKYLKRFLLEHFEE